MEFMCGPGEIEAKRVRILDSRIRISQPGLGIRIHESESGVSIQHSEIRNPESKFQICDFIILILDNMYVKCVSNAQNID